MLLTLLALAAGQTVPPTAEGWRDAWIAGATARIERACAREMNSPEPLESKQKGWRERFLESMGLHPLPERTPLQPVITGATETEKFKVEKIHFQSCTGLYVTGNLYLPRQVKAPAPAVLYVCGHATQVREETGPDGTKAKVAYGSKVPYQHHPALFAENGYVCLIIDTLQLGEIEGIHHGTHRLNRWWWHDRGYTPAGVELWNAMRALDYLETRPEVDHSRLAVTGRSGGGATSWWLAAADKRVKASVPVAGLSDLRGHVIQGEMAPNRPGCITGHCDCMYFHNVGGLDFAHIIALCAPRATLLGNSDKDPIFPVGGYRRPAALARQAFAQSGKPDALALMETAGGHLDTPELRQGAMSWIDRHASGLPSHDLCNRKPAPLDPKCLKVFATLPADERNTNVDEWFVPKAIHPVPDKAEEAQLWLATQPDRLRNQLLRTSFAHWPFNHQTPPRLLSSQIRGQRCLEKWSVEVEPGLELPLVVDSPTGKQSTKTVRVRIAPLVEAEANLGEFPANNPGEVVVNFAPRGINPNTWPETHSDPDGKPRNHMTRRRLALVGATVESGQVFDILQMARVLENIPQTIGIPKVLQANGTMGVNTLYASLFTRGPVRLQLDGLPASQKEGPHYLHVARWLDVPQAVACSRATSVHLSRANPDEPGWKWLEAMARLAPESFRLEYP